MTRSLPGLRGLALKSRRIYLRPFVRADAKDIVSAVTLSMPHLQLFMSWAAPGYSLVDARDFVRRARTWRMRGIAYAFGVFDARTHELLGSNGIHNLARSTRSAEIGYWIRSDAAGRGLATESSALMLQFSFEVLDRHRVILRAATDNLGSNRVAEKLGFRLDGVQRQEARLARGWLDFNYYAMLDSEYRQNREMILSYIHAKKD